MLISGVFKAIPWQAWVVIGVVLIGAFALHRYTSSVREAAFQQFHAAAMEQAMQAKEKEIAILRQDKVDRDEALSALNQRNTELSASYDQLVEKLRKSQNGPVAPVLRDAIEGLKLLNRPDLTKPNKSE